MEQKDTQPASECLFVYGTLRRGQPLHRYLTTPETKFVGEGSIVGRLFDLGEHPAATSDPKRFSIVRGEVHAILDPDKIFPILDDVEGYDARSPERSLFERRSVDVHMENGRILKAWVYFYRKTLGRAIEIPDGDYARYRAE